MYIVAIIAGAGTGTRVGSPIPKQYLSIHNRPLIYYTIKAFVTAYPTITLILVVAPTQEPTIVLIMEQYFATHKYTLVHGGSTRQQSVTNGIQAIPQQHGIVLIHDAARCMVTPALIQACVLHTATHGNAVPSMPVTDSIRQVHTAGNIAIDRSTLQAIQTPQTFEIALIKNIVQHAATSNYTDEASMLDAVGIPVHLIPGCAYNIKVTTPADVLLASTLLQP